MAWNPLTVRTSITRRLAAPECGLSRLAVRGAATHQCTSLLLLGLVHSLCLRAVSIGYRPARRA